MNIATGMSVAFLCLSVCAASADDKQPAFFCNLNAISHAKRPRYNELVKKIRGAVQNRTEVRDGYEFKLDSRVVELVEIAEWVSLERLCCPFLTLEVSTSGRQPPWLLRLTGPKGVKPLIREEFPER